MVQTEQLKSVVVMQLILLHNDQAHRQQWSAAEKLSVCSALLEHS